MKLHSRRKQQGKKCNDQSNKELFHGMRRKGIKGIILVIQMDCHGSWHSPRNDQLPVIANEVKHSSFSHSSLRAKRSNPATKQIYLQSGSPRLIIFASQWQVTRSFHSLAKTANRSFILYDQFAHKVPLNFHYSLNEYQPKPGRRGYSLY